MYVWGEWVGWILGSKVFWGQEDRRFLRSEGRTTVKMDLEPMDHVWLSPTTGRWGWGQGYRLGLQVKERFLLLRQKQWSFLSPAPGNHQKQGNSSKPSHHEESLAHAKRLQLDEGKNTTNKSTTRKNFLCTGLQEEEREGVEPLW